MKSESVAAICFELVHFVKFLKGNRTILHPVLRRKCSLVTLIDMKGVDVSRFRGEVRRTSMHNEAVDENGIAGFDLDWHECFLVIFWQFVCVDEIFALIKLLLVGIADESSCQRSLNIKTN